MISAWWLMIVVPVAGYAGFVGSNAMWLRLARRSEAGPYKDDAWTTPGTDPALAAMGIPVVDCKDPMCSHPECQDPPCTRS